MSTLDSELKIAVEAARKAGAILKANFQKKYRVIRKSPKELVSEIDLKAQRAIVDTLREHDRRYGIITEEKVMQESQPDRNWIIDPLDGTHNYIAGLPFSGVSIGLANGSDFLLGVIYFPAEDQLFHGIKGRGAYLNGRPVRVSKNRHLSRAIVNYDNQFHFSHQSLEYFKRLSERAFTIRIFGTATRDLCLIASGMIDGRIWVKTKICDIAGGLVILSEAGGKITRFDGSPCRLDSQQVVASNGGIHDQLLEIVKG